MIRPRKTGAAGVVGVVQATEWLVNAQPADLRAQDVIRIIGLHVDYVKNFEADRESTDEDGWSEEDEAAVAEIVREVVALAEPESSGEEENPSKVSDEDSGPHKGPTAQP